MKNKQTLLIISIFFTVSATAQLSPRNKKTFERSLALIVNNAADHFQPIKGKSVKQRNDYFDGKQYDLDLVLPGVDKSFLVLRKNESLVYIEVGSFNEFEDGFKVYTNLIDQLHEALRKRVYFCTDSSDNSEGSKQTRAGLKSLTGFFATNINIDFQLLAGKYVLSMQIKGGIPELYSVVPKMQSGQSLLFRYQFNDVQKGYSNNNFACAELPGYVCSVAKEICTITQYKKQTDEELNAKYEFSNLFTEVKAALKEEYVYVHKETNKPVLNEIVFIKKDEICQPVKKMIRLRLTKTGSKLYDITIEFVSLPTVVLIP